MKKLLAILILIFTFHTPSWADDIRDFQIEGMSIGDSALDFFDKSEITKNYLFPNKKFASFAGYGKNFKTYDGFQIFFYDDDENYIIHYLAGKILYDNNAMEKCYDRMYKIVEDIKKILPNVDFNDEEKRKHPADKSGKSTGKQTFFNFNDGSELAVSCMDWSLEMQKDGSHSDNLAVNARSVEYAKWLNSDEAYKPE